ncbi:hypothetical protein IRZ70_06815 [Pseudomonas monteilii]|nr:hypothetical protein [Pseudomonas monteilii]
MDIPHVPVGIAAAQAFQDGIIAKRLPSWLLAADESQRASLEQALQLSLYFQQRVRNVLERIQPIDAFAALKLQQALEARYGVRYQVGHWRFRHGRWEPVINSQPVGTHLSQARYEDIPLVEAALRNFTHNEAQAREAPADTGLWSRIGTALEDLFSGRTKEDFQARDNSLVNPQGIPEAIPSAIEFAALCRALDVGGQYQRHLEAVLRPSAKHDEPWENVASLLARSHRYAMLVDAYRACSSGALSDAELRLVVMLCLLRGPLRLDGAPVVAKQLKLLGCSLEQIVVLDVIDQGTLRDTSRRVLVHVPGDPQGAWRSYRDLRYFANDLGKRLRTPEYQKFFSRFVRRRDAQGFFQTVRERYRGLSDLANAALDEHALAYPQDLFGSLASARIEHIMDDAAMIAVPVAQLDREVQRAHDERLNAEGWALLNLAGFFVPGIGMALLAVSAWELLGEAFHGIEAWHEGDTSEALDHLLNVARDVALVGVSAVGATVASRLWNRSAVVDSLVPARLEGGATKLWNQDLAAYRSEALPAGAVRDEAGVHHLQGRTWVEMDGHYYPVRQGTEDGQWHLLPARSMSRWWPREAYAPMLRHNGVGAWRLWSENPGQWEDPRYLFRRLGGRFRELDDERIGQLLAFHDLGAEHLRGLHIQGRVPDAELLDSVMRIGLDLRIRRAVQRLRAGQSCDDLVVLQGARHLPGAQALPDHALAELAWRERRLLLQRLYEGFQDSDSPGTAALRRVFPSLHRRVAQALLDAASAQERQRLLDSGRVSMRLANAARAAVMRLRTVRVYEALYFDTPQTVDLARVVLGLLNDLSFRGARIRWRLFERYIGGPLLYAGEAGDSAFDLVHVNGRFILLNGHGHIQGDAGELFEVIASAFDESQRNALAVGEPLAHNLRVMVGRVALRQRQEVQRLLGAGEPMGWLRMPLRQSDGRIGYPLSGRRPGTSREQPAPQGLMARVRELYPTFTDAQVIAFIEDIRGSVEGVEIRLAQLEAELRSLSRSLSFWIGASRNAAEQDDRFAFAEAMLGCWQRRVMIGGENDSPNVRYWWSQVQIAPGILPDLPEGVRFNHVAVLSLRGLGLEQVPDGFLRAFANLQTLELSGNRVTRLPDFLMYMEHLEYLDLYGNGITLDNGQRLTLSHCRNLVYLNLSHNPLGQGFPLHGMPNLCELHMRNTGLVEIPDGVSNCQWLRTLDLSDNQITALQDSFFHTRVWTAGVVRMAGNPLPEAQLQVVQTARQGMGAGVGSAIPARLRWIDAISGEQRDDMAALWAEAEGLPGAEEFIALLEDLLGTTEFQQRIGAQNLANRVYALLDAIIRAPALREELFVNAGALTCVDSVALRFSDLEVRALVWQAQQPASGDGQHGLLHLGRQLWRLETLDGIARQDIQARLASAIAPGEIDEIDPIEIVLAYRLALRSDLDLPVQTRAMQFLDLAHVEAWQIESARARVLETETPECLAASLVDRDFWQLHLRRTQSSRFDEFNAPFHQRVESLMEDEQVPEAERLARINQVNQERAQGERDLMLELTREAMELAPAAQGAPER